MEEILCQTEGRNPKRVHFLFEDAVGQWKELSAGAGISPSRLVIYSHTTRQHGKHWHVGHITKAEYEAAMAQRGEVRVH